MTDLTEANDAEREHLIEESDNVIRLVSADQQGSLKAFVREAGARMDAQQSELEESEIAKDLVRRIRKKDPAAEDALDQRYRGRLRYVLMRQMPQFPHDVEDLVQESLSIAIFRLREGKIEDPERLGGYIYGIARNLRFRKVEELSRRDKLSDPDFVDSIPDDQLPPDEVVANEETTLIMRRVIAELGTTTGELRDREVLLRYFIYEQDKIEIKEALGIKDPEHVRKVVSRAKGRLKKLLLEAKTGLGGSLED